MNSVPKINANDDLSSAVRNAESGSRTILTRDGKPVAALVPMEDYQTIESLEEQEDRLDVEEAEAVLADSEQAKRVSWDVIKRDLGL